VLQLFVFTSFEVGLVWFGLVWLGQLESVFPSPFPLPPYRPSCAESVEAALWQRINANEPRPLLPSPPPPLHTHPPPPHFRANGMFVFLSVFCM